METKNPPKSPLLILLQLPSLILKVLSSLSKHTTEKLNIVLTQDSNCWIFSTRNHFL